VAVIIQREWNNQGFRRVCDENDILIGSVFKHEHPGGEGIPAEIEWQFTEGTLGLFSASTLRELRWMIKQHVGEEPGCSICGSVCSQWGCPNGC
jgi:hypothetical protein